MTPSRAELRRLLVAAGRDPVPAPRPEFVDSLRAHLVDLWPQRTVGRRPQVQMSSRQVRRLVANTGTVPAPAPSPAYVVTLRDRLRHNWVPGTDGIHAQRRQPRVRYAVAAAAALLGGVLIGGRALTNAEDSNPVASREATITHDGQKQTVSTKELDGLELEDGATLRVRTPGSYVLEFNGSRQVITGKVKFRDGVVTVDGIPVPPEETGGGDTQTAAGSEKPRIERAPADTTTTTEPPASTTTTTEPPTSSTTTTTAPFEPASGSPDK